MHIKAVFFTFFLMLLTCALTPASMGKVVSKDKDNDGHPEQRAHFQGSELILLEVDSDADHTFERKQHYQDGQLQRVERDRDQDGFWETVDIYEQGTRRKQTVRSPDGVLQQVSTFDPQGRPVRIHKNRSGGYHLDTIYIYAQGKLQRIGTDVDGNNIWESLQIFEQETLVEHRLDENQDQTPERIVIYNTQGQPTRSEHDLDEDGFRETRREYSQGQVHIQKTLAPAGKDLRILTQFEHGRPTLQKKDQDLDGHFEVINHFQQGRIHKQQKDTNADTRFDTLILFNARGDIREMHQDTNHNGHQDRIVSMQRGTIHREKLDTDHDRFFETEMTYAQSTRKRMRKDRDQDGTPDMIVDYNDQGERRKLSLDTNQDQSMDTWQYYAHSNLARMEKDESGNGRVDLKVTYTNGHKEKLLRDQDGDGHFETAQLYTDPKWDLIIAQDRDGNDQPEVKLKYAKGLLRQKEVYTPEGEIQFIEYFDSQGNLSKSREREEKGLSLTWIYNDQGQAVQAKRDRDLDGQFEVIFSYTNGTLRSVEEDTNEDGKIDLWESYDQSEALISTRQDLDYDGQPDVQNK